MDTATVVAGSMTYFVSNSEIPTRDQLPWCDEECDAFVAILDTDLLTDKVANEVSLGLVMLSTGWIETMGRKAEFLHDLLDNASVSIGRQSRVGDGDPMTAWHENLSEIDRMIDYVKLGGHGASENKLVIIIGSERSARVFADKLRA